MNAQVGVPYGAEVAELVTALAIVDGKRFPCSDEVRASVAELAVYRARQVARFYINALGLREGPAKPSPFVLGTFEVR